jgi:hypothetical protein
VTTIAAASSVVTRISQVPTRNRVTGTTASIAASLASGVNITLEG